jgi:hypothetical protein
MILQSGLATRFCFRPTKSGMSCKNILRRLPKTCVRVIWLHAQFKIKSRLIIQFTIGLAMLVASVSGANSVDVASLDGIESADSVEESIKLEVLEEPTTVEKTVNEYFKDTPILSKVAFCESRYRQFNAEGQVLRGVVNPKDVGVFQINEDYHLADSLKLGIDIYTLEGNLAYAKHLYETKGVSPWVHSSKCWSKGEGIALNK